MPLTLDDARSVGDKAADHVVAAFAGDHPDLAVRDIVAKMVEEIRRDPQHQHPAVRSYFVEGPDLPDWVDPDRVVQGQRFFRDNGLLIGASLFCASLPEAYAAADGVEVLAVTAELVSHVRRRIAETGQLLIEVMALDEANAGHGPASIASLRPGGRAYRSVRGVRLMHSAVRLLAQDHLGDDWVRDHGVPVNQQDLVGTLLTFTSVVYRALDRLGIEYEEEAAEAHLHAWCVVGWLLGIEEELLPWCRQDADETAALLRTRLQAPSPAGRLLATALLEELEETMPWGARSVPRTVTRYLVGDRCADILGMPPAGRWRLVLGPVREVDEAGGKLSPSSAAARLFCRKVSRSLFSEYVSRGLRGERPTFDVPDDLAAGWRLRPHVQAKRARRRARRSGAGFDTAGPSR